MHYTSKTINAAEKIIAEIKEKNGKIKFPIDPFEILKSKKVLITFSDFDKLEGLLLYDTQKESIVSINLNRPVTRQRFTAAHELGHIILHTEINGTNFLCPIYGMKSPIEKEADDFASHLLMPTDELEKMIEKYANEDGKVGLDECLYIAEYFGVSFESCVKTIRFRLNGFIEEIDNKELDKMIRKFKPNIKRKELFEKTNELELLLNSINYSYFSIININDIIGIKFMQNLVYHDSRLENVNLSIEQINVLYADFRMNGSESKYCKEDNQNIIEALGNIEMNKYCLETTDEINIFKIRDLNSLLYKYTPYPEYTGTFRTNDNLILGGTIQPVAVSDMFDKMNELNDLITNLINNIEKYNVSEYITKVAIIHYKFTILHPFNEPNGIRYFFYL